MDGSRTPRAYLVPSFTLTCCSGACEAARDMPVITLPLREAACRPRNGRSPAEAAHSVRYQRACILHAGTCTEPPTTHRNTQPYSFFLPMLCALFVEYYTQVCKRTAAPMFVSCSTADRSRWYAQLAHSQ